MVFREGVDMFRSLLVPVDGSAFAEHALPLALSIARRAGAGIQLVHVHTSLVDNPKAYGFDFLAVDAHTMEEHRVYLDTLNQRIRKVSSVPLTTSFLEGEIAETLRVTASSTGTDLVVMTTHGRGPLLRFWVGSVADALVRQLSVPLLLLRPHENGVDLTKEPVIKRMVLPLDGSALAEQILPPALDFGRLMEAELTLLRVIKPGLSAGLSRGRDRRELRSTSRALNARDREGSGSALPRSSGLLGRRG
jgi:nucleotide-binding universal stress UspA family protein